METLIMYEVKVAACIAVFYAFYRLLLSRETLHRMNRIVLISTAILSFVLPVCVITVKKVVVLPAVSQNIGAIMNSGTEAMDAAAEWWWTALAVVYAVGILVCLVRTGISVLGVYNLMRKGQVAYTEDGFKMVIVNDDIAPCSWMHTIILPRADYEENCAGILAHEKAHIDLGHTNDVLVVDILTAFQWFNPMMWMLRADLRAVHEFEADDAVLCKGVNIKEYLHLLIKKAISESGYSVTNSFNHSILKNRITMMSKSKSNIVRGLRVLYILPLVCISLALNAEEKINYVMPDNGKDSKNVLESKDDSRLVGKIDTVVYVGTNETAVYSFGEDTTMVKDSKTIVIKAEPVSETTDVLIVCDGKIISGSDMNSIPSETIESMSVIKVDEEIRKYQGEYNIQRPVDGVIVITLKKE